jgi:hypothetical protein
LTSQCGHWRRSQSRGRLPRAQTHGSGGETSEGREGGRGNVSNCEVGPKGPLVQVQPDVVAECITAPWSPQLHAPLQLATSGFHCIVTGLEKPSRC